MSGIGDAGYTGDQPKQGWFERLKSGLSRSSSNLQNNIASVFTGRKLDAASLEELEEALISADMGVETSMELTETLSQTRFGKDVGEQEVRQALADEIAGLLEPVAKPLVIDPGHRPEVILVCGVNGTGKTTTIGKFAQQLVNDGKRVMLAAGDTFRAAAIEQLEVWGRRTDCPVIAKAPGADAAGLAFEALEKASATGSDVLLIDTAGRLHNKSALMDELAKIVRVVKKLDPEAPHTVLLVLDATTGQNALSQAQIFREVADVSGIV
ncbi:MAG: signal recognition particle-docking protein FtsY, partial [Geminicoccaceae bacterium]